MLQFFGTHVPASAAGDADQMLRGDMTWGDRTATFMSIRLATTDQGIANSTWSAISFNLENSDADGFFPGTGETITVPTGAKYNGYYLILAGAVFAADATGSRHIRIKKEGSVVRTVQVLSFSDTLPTFQASTVVELAEGDEVTVEVRQLSGVALDLQATGDTFIQLVKLGDE